MRSVLRDNIVLNIDTAPIIKPHHLLALRYPDRLYLNFLNIGLAALYQILYVLKLLV